jgi:hypothetical protein
MDGGAVSHFVKERLPTLTKQVPVPATMHLSLTRYGPTGGRLRRRSPRTRPPVRASSSGAT